MPIEEHEEAFFFWHQRLEPAEQIALRGWGKQIWENKETGECRPPSACSILSGM
jgi:hypothetical protein